MELLDEIIAYLKDQHLESIVNSIQSELKSQKKIQNSKSRILDNLIVSSLPGPAKTSLNNLLKKLTRKPLPSIPAPIQSLKLYKNYDRHLKKPLKPSKPPSIVQDPPKISPNLKNLPEISIEYIQEPSSIMQPSNISFVHMLEDQDLMDEFDNEDDPGFILYETTADDFLATCKEIAHKHNFPDCMQAKQRETKPFEKAEEKNSETSIKFPETFNKHYPVTHENSVYDCYNFKVIFDREKTGFEESKDFQIVINSVIAARYQVIEFLGSAAFSKAIQCLDLVTDQMVCLKIIENNKDYVDQSIDEIKLLLYVDCNGNVEEKNLLKMYDFFYHKEHLFIVTELLKDNLYEYSKFNREHEETQYFTIGRLQKIAHQVLIGLEYLASLKLIHCDLKPENILIKSFSNCEVKIIDLGSTCFIHDHLGSYVQSRSYRAPEVIIGSKYDYRVDIWSLGCIIAELYTGNVLFQNESVQGLLARIIAICGPIPEEILKAGRHTNKFFTREKLIFQEVVEEKDNNHLSEDMIQIIKQHKQDKKRVNILVPKKSNLKSRLRCEDPMFLDFVRCLLDIDKDRRPTATEALKHPFLTECKYQDGL